MKNNHRLPSSRPVAGRRYIAKPKLKGCRKRVEGLARQNKPESFVRALSDTQEDPLQDNEAFGALAQGLPRTD